MIIPNVNRNPLITTIFDKKVNIEEYSTRVLNSQRAATYKNKELSNACNAISLVYNLKHISKYIWHDNFRKKCDLRNKKQNNINQKQKNNKPLKFLLFYKQNKKKHRKVKNQWYYYNDAFYRKKIKLNEHQNNSATVYNKMGINKFFLGLRKLSKRKRNKVNKKKYAKA